MPYGYDKTRSERRCKDCDKLLYVFEVGEFCIECQGNRQRLDQYIYKQGKWRKTMTEPEVPQKRPYPMQVEAGKEYHVCMCGKSQNQPLCDGSHAGSGLGPKVFKATEAGFVAFCGCKHSADETGKCDGTHGSL